MTTLNGHRRCPEGSAVPPLDPPGWAARSVAEDGGVTHERLSSARPAVLRWSGVGVLLVPTEVSVSARDLCDGGGWMRSAPTVQIEGGSYSLDGVRALRAALDDLLTCVGADVERPSRSA
jgi:hypothetical protein